MVETVPGGAFVDALAPGKSLARDVGWVAGFAVLTALAAQAVIRLPFTPVPVTGQTFAFLLGGGLLGVRRGVLAQVVYVLMGVFGLPVFAGGSHGVLVLLGATGGYLLGGILASGLVGWAAERGWLTGVWRSVLAMLAGEAAIYALGLAVLSRYVPPSRLLTDGLVPFIPGDALKLLLAASLLPLGFRLVGRRGRAAGAP